MSNSTVSATPTSSDGDDSSSSTPTAVTTPSSSPPVPSSSSPPPPPSSSAPPPLTTPTPTPSSRPPPPPPPPSPSPSPATTVITSVITDNNTSQITQVVTITSVAPQQPTQAPPPTTTTPAPSTSSSPGVLPNTHDDNSSGGLDSKGKTAIAVVVPVVAVALLVLAGLFLWRRRKQRKNAEEARRKEVEDYGYNPNADPTLPAVGGVAGSEMAEDSSGYRGWGTTNASNRKTSTTLSGGMTGLSDTGSNPGGYGNASSPGGAVSDGHSSDPLMQNRNTMDSETVAALGAGPAAGANRNDGIRRGPSNASSSYSAGGNRSNGSDDGHMAMNGNSNDYYYNDNAFYQQGANGYAENGGYGGAEAQQPVIRDVSARRNTRIESPRHLPQGNSGISQNF